MKQMKSEFTTRAATVESGRVRLRPLLKAAPSSIATPRQQSVASGRVLEPVNRSRPWYVSLARFARRKPVGAISVGIIVAFWLMAAFAPLLAPYGPKETLVGNPFTPPNGQFWLGTDHLGQDVLSRLIWGSRLSLMVSLFSVVTGTVLGSLLGLISGYFMGKFDLVVQRLTDAAQAMPYLVLLLAIVAVLGTHIFYVLVALSLITIPAGTRVLRSAVLTTRQAVYVEAAKAIGASERRIIFRHILPNSLAPLIILISIGLGTNLLAQSSLSFLGFVDSNYPDWGGMLSGGARSYLERMPWLALAPGAAISLAVLAYNMAGDTLRDIFDPRLKGTR